MKPNPILTKILQDFDERFWFPNLNRAETADYRYPTSSSLKAFISSSLQQALRETLEELLLEFSEVQEDLDKEYPDKNYSPNYVGIVMKKLDTLLRK